MEIILLILCISALLAWYIDRSMILKKYTEEVLPESEFNKKLVREIQEEAKKHEHAININEYFIEEGMDLQDLCKYINKHFGDRIMHYKVIEITDAGVKTKFFNNVMTITHKNYVIQTLQQMILNNVRKFYP